MLANLVDLLRERAILLVIDAFEGNFDDGVLRAVLDEIAERGPVAASALAATSTWLASNSYPKLFASLATNRASSPDSSGRSRWSK